MENNIREIKEKCCVFSKCIDIDLDFQENLMAYNDDMLKIIRCSINNFVINTEYNGGSLTIHGKSKIYLTYVSEATSSLTTADFEEDFQKSVSIEGTYEDVSADVFITNKYSNFRVINQRRIDIHNAFSINVKVYAGIPVKMIDSYSDILLKHESINYLSLTGSAYVRAEFEEEATISEDSELIKRIINTYSNIHSSEIKIIKNKMLVKGIAEFSMLYTTDTENEIIKRCEKSVAISKIIDIEGIDEGDNAIVNINLGNLYVKPKPDRNNELRLIELLGDVNINISVFRKMEAQLTTDAYATDYEINNSFSKVTFNTDGEIINDIINEKCTFEFDNINIVEVADLCLNINDGKSIELSALIRNEKSDILFISQKKEIYNSTFSTSAFYIKSYDYVINSSNQITVRYLIEYNAIKYKEKSFNILSEINVSENALEDSPALVVYFAKENEQLWDIAKKFRTSVELIKTENEINSDVLDIRRILLIPGI